MDRLAALAAPWQSLYADSSVVSSAVLFAHLGAMLVAGGLALAADRATLRAARASADARAWQRAELAATHRPVVTALVVVAASGALLFLADVETYATSRAYWLKMALVAALLANGWRMTRLERALAGAARGQPTDAAWTSLRGAARTSAALWLAIVLAGVVLANG